MKRSAGKHLNSSAGQSQLAVCNIVILCLLLLENKSKYDNKEGRAKIKENE